MNKYKYHYTYRIENILTNNYYIGRRSCNRLPSDDIGVVYYSSSYNKPFMIDQRENPQNYKYDILKIFDNIEDMINHEIYLHESLNVKDGIKDRKEMTVRMFMNWYNNVIKKHEKVIT